MLCTHELAKLSSPGSRLPDAVWISVCQNMTQTVFFLSAMVTAPWEKPSTGLTSPVLSWTPGDSTMS